MFSRVLIDRLRSVVVDGHVRYAQAGVFVKRILY